MQIHIVFNKELPLEAHLDAESALRRVTELGAKAQARSVLRHTRSQPRDCYHVHKVPFMFDKPQDVMEAMHEEIKPQCGARLEGEGDS